MKIDDKVNPLPPNDRMESIDQEMLLRWMRIKSIPNEVKRPNPRFVKESKVK